MVAQQMQLYLMPLNCTLKIVKMLYFMLCISYHNKIYNYSEGELTGLIQALPQIEETMST